MRGVHEAGRAVTQMDVSFFLTAYDPSDLPGGSADQMGFERGYVLLADKILPGPTNAGSRPRYPASCHALDTGDTDSFCRDLSHLNFRSDSADALIAAEALTAWSRDIGLTTVRLMYLGNPRKEKRPTQKPC